MYDATTTSPKSLERSGPAVFYLMHHKMQPAYSFLEERYLRGLLFIPFLALFPSFYRYILLHTLSPFHQFILN
jgi:hypothetical protein